MARARLQGFRVMREALQVAVARASRAHSPTEPVGIYVPRGAHPGALDGVPLGAGIVGSQWDDGLLRIEWGHTELAAPNLRVWSSWVADAACLHHNEHDELSRDLVSELEVVLVGWHKGEHVTIRDETRGDLWRWLYAGHEAFMRTAGQRR
jgi:hypothetical protein